MTSYNMERFHSDIYFYFYTIEEMKNIGPWSDYEVINDYVWPLFRYTNSLHM